MGSTAACGRPRPGTTMPTESPTSTSAPPPAAMVWRARAERRLFNTDVSFVSITNWQSYSGETAMCHITQTAGRGRLARRGDRTTCRGGRSLPGQVHTPGRRGVGHGGAGARPMSTLGLAGRVSCYSASPNAESSA
uniref:potassium-transporting ATPase subunit KdpA n=1 Tax=Streptomyces akebiae TaxID=2865673 RepID=UPI0037D9E344